MMIVYAQDVGSTNNNVKKYNYLSFEVHILHIVKTKIRHKVHQNHVIKYTDQPV
jgi:hypothetical protein